jgi:putative membrane protein
LLLVFRTNSAYDRFWEARKIWSAMIASIRDFSRLAHSSLSGWDREHTLQLLAALPPILLQVESVLLIEY